MSDIFYRVEIMGARETADCEILPYSKPILDREAWHQNAKYVQALADRWNRANRCSAGEAVVVYAIAPVRFL